MAKFRVYLLIFSAGLLILSCGVVEGQKTLEENLATPFSEQLDLLSKEGDLATPFSEQLDILFKQESLF